MQITIFGASGKVGRRVTRFALENGHEVVALVHSHKLPIVHARLTAVTGDIHNLDDIEQAVQGSEAIIVTLGSWGNKNGHIVSSGVKNIITVMQKQGIKRIITLTGSAAYGSDDRPSWGQLLGRLWIHLVAAGVHEDGERQLHLLQASSLQWTCIRSPAMTERGSHHYQLNTRLKPIFATIPRAAVAACIIDQLDDTAWLQKAPTIRR